MNDIPNKQMMYHNPNLTSGDTSRYNKFNVVEVSILKSSEITVHQSGKRKATPKETVTDEYEKEFETSIALLKKHHNNVDAIKHKKKPILSMLWCGFEKFWRSNDKNPDAALPELKKDLKDKIAANPSWIADARRKLASKKARKSEE